MTMTIALVFSVLVSLGAADAQEPAAPARHTWTEIRYPDLTQPWSHGRQVGVMLAPDADAGRLAVHLFLSFEDSRPEDDALFAAMFEDPKVEVHLHQPQGAIASPAGGQPVCRGGVHRMGCTSVTLTCDFAWLADPLAEAWIEIRGDRSTAWLEVPYGFTVNGASLDTNARPDGGPPQRAEQCKGFLDGHQVVPWTSVTYEVGQLDDGSRLSLRQSNPGDGRSEVVLYRDPAGVGQFADRWDLHEPRTKVHLRVSATETVGARAIEVRLHDDTLRRSDVHALHRVTGRQRSWAELVVAVEDQERRVWLPSSMFRFVHGHAR
jgi:hypothetical protein